MNDMPIRVMNKIYHGQQYDELRIAQLRWIRDRVRHIKASASKEALLPLLFELEEQLDKELEE